MADETREASRRRLIANALNSARGANIFDDGLAELIGDYFVSDSTEEDDEKSDGAEDLASESDESTASEDGEREADDDNGPIIDTAMPALELDINNDLDGLSRDEEWVKVENFDCGCKSRAADEAEPQAKSRTQGCISQFSVEEIFARRMSMAEYCEAEKDNLLLGIIQTLPRNTSEFTIAKKSRQKKRKLERRTYTVDGKIVCRETFKFIYGISQNKLTALLKHYRENGTAPRLKKSGGRKCNTNAITVQDTQRIVQFLQSYAENHGLVLPGRVPGFKRSDVKVLPTSESKASLWRQYRQAAVARGVRAVGKTTFCKVWAQHVPFIVVGRPMTDLCWHCKQNNERIRRSANLPEEEKMAVLGEQLEHLRTVEAERALYNKMVEESKAAAAAADLTALGPHQPNTLPAKIHYSFDFAQQVHLPSSPLQPGPLYFLVPRKCGIFGVCCEALPKQVNYLIDEGMCSGKGANMVISLLHHFLENYGLGEMEVDLHCDNCTGQNKNRWMLFYLAWRVMCGKHTTITLNFMPAGHTKFAPDWCFGFLKRRFKRCEVNCLEDMCQVVESSTPTKQVNMAQLVGTEDGRVVVPVYNWQAFFGGWFRPLKGIKSIYHFKFTTDRVGTVQFQKTLDGPVQCFDLVSDVQAARPWLVNRMPATVPPPGLPQARQEYLRTYIRPFVRQEMMDILCP